WNRVDRLGTAHSREQAPAMLDPVAFGQGRATHALGNLGDGRYANVIGLDRAVEARAAAVAAHAFMLADALAVLAGRRHPEAQALVAQALGQRPRSVGEIDFLAAANATVGFQQALHQRQCLHAWQMAETTVDALVVCFVVNIARGKRQRRLTGAGNAPSGGIAQHAAASSPMDLTVAFAARAFPIMDAALT